MSINFSETIKFDLLRYRQIGSVHNFTVCYFFIPEFRYIFWVRAAFFSRQKKFWRPLHWFCRWCLARTGYRLGISIPYNTVIGPGFYIGHSGGIVVSPNTVIGKNCNISCGVVIGETFRGKRMGVPRIGNYVYIAPGSKIIGAILVGNNVAVGANSVVTKNVPDNAVVAGVPAKIISYNKGAAEYVQRVI